TDAAALDNDRPSARSRAQPGAGRSSGRIDPAPNASISGPSSAFSVRFDRPVDHAHSVIFIKRDGKTVETLHPRLQSAPEVLFARAPTLPPGAYTLHWQVKTMTEAVAVEGEIRLTVVPSN